MAGRIVILTVAVALDPIPGAFHTKESAVETVQRLLDNGIGHYNPIVILAPDQPS